MKSCEKPCKTCPFLKANFGRENPSGFDKLKESDNSLQDWYSPQNLSRLWREGLRNGDPMICHSSDPNAEEYGGKNAQPGHEKLCTGSIILIFKHIKFLERRIKQGSDYKIALKEYRKSSKYPLTKIGQTIWLWMFAIGKTDLMGGLTLPKGVAVATEQKPTMFA